MTLPDFSANAALWTIILLAIPATYIWRAIGVWASGRIDVNGWVFTWVSYIAYGLLAALVARMIVLPVGALVDTHTGLRVACAALGLGAFFLTKKNIAAGVGAGAGSLLLAVAYF